MQQTECPSVDRLRAGLEGSAEGPLLAQHVEGCSSCQSRLGALTAGATGLDDWLRAAGDTPVVAADTALRAALLRLADEPSVDAPRLAGTRIGEYRLEQPLGEGGMGTVWRATHTRLDKPVALKLLSRKLSRHPDAIARFAREMKAVGRLRHPNIVLAMDAGEWDGTPYLVMEFVDGVDLGRFVKQRGMLPVAEACEVARRAAIGLQHAHEHGMVHRDVKPSNLMLTADGTVKLLDLGLARLPDAGELPASGEGDAVTRCAAADLTETNMMVGTSSYMAPEQRRDPRTVDGRADLYSLGRTLCFLLTGETVLPAAGAVPGGLLKVLQRLQAERAEDRYASAATIAETLRPWCRGHDVGGLLGVRRRRTERRNRILMGAALLAIAGIGMAIALHYSGNPEAQPVANGEPAASEAKKSAPNPGEVGMSATEATQLQQQWANYLQLAPTIENTIGMKLALVPPGELNLTLAAPRANHATLLARNNRGHTAQFRQFVDATNYRTEVETKGRGQYQVFVKTGNSGGTRARRNPQYSWRNPGYSPVADDDPVTQVSWNDALAYCRWLSQTDGKAYRLPTKAEAQWASRAGEDGPYPGNHPDGDLLRSLELMAWTSLTSPDRPHPVSGLRPNVWGLFDMLGNVGEWVQDWWGEPAAGVHSDYQGPPEGKLRLIYGGAYTSRPGYTAEIALSPGWGSSSIGFRVLREP